MRAKTFLITLIISLFSEILLSQNLDNKSSTLQNKNQIGIQFNAYLDEHLFHGLIMETVYSIRYGYKISNPIIIGAEVLGYFPFADT